MVSLLSMLIFIVMVLLTLSNFMKSNLVKMKREKMSSFECGFEPEHNMRNAFSLRFFIITIIFLVFDVEVTVMMPIPLGESMSSTPIYLSVNFILFTLLLGGLLFEWKQGALEWY